MRKTLVALVLSTMLSTVLLSGCAAQPAEPPPATPGAGSTASETPEPDRSAAGTTPVATEEPAPSEAPAEIIVAVDPATYAGFTPNVTASADFRTPSSNESCGIYVTDDPNEVFWGCAPQEHDFALPERGGANDTCAEQLHLTGGIEAHNHDLPTLSCRNDAPFSGQADPTVPVLEEGTSVALAGVTCTSRDDGVTCIADSSGRGFVLSRSAYSIF